MEPEAEDPGNNDNLVPWLGSDGSQDLCVSESFAESYYEDDASDAELDPQPAHILKSDLESPEHLQSHDWESAGEQQSLPELSGSDEDVAYQEEDDFYLSESRESITESPHIQTSPTSLSPHPERPGPEPHAGRISQPHSQSSSSSLGCAADMTLALTLTTEQHPGASNRQGPGTGNRRVESSEEGGSSEAPPASVFFGISDEAWMRRSPSGEPYIPPRSPVSQPSHSPPGPHSQHYLPQQDWAQPQQMANHWAPDQTQATLQTPANAWAPVNSSSQLHLQPTTNSWSQQPPRSPVSMHARSPTYSPHHPPSPSRNKSDSAPHSVASCPPQAGKSLVHASKATQASPKGRVSDKGINRAGDGPTMAGKGAELFAKRQSRMEKFVVDAETVQANKTRSPSPTLSLPNFWRYSSNVRAPPPLSYNPILAPFYPPSAAKQLPSTSPKIKPKTKEKPKAPSKHLNTLDIMKHQPYQLDSSLFKYDAVPEAKSPTPKPTPASKFEVTKSLKLRSAPSHSPYNTPDLAVQSKAEVPAKSPVSVSSQNSSARRNTRSAEPLATGKRLDEKHTVTPAAHHISNKQAPSARPASTSSQQSSIGDSIASAFSPASLIARGARQMAPRPKFSAKKPVVTGTQWRPVVVLH